VTLCLRHGLAKLLRDLEAGMLMVDEFDDEELLIGEEHGDEDGKRCSHWNMA